ncbi:HAUS augmin-like complex subunit 1 [Centruroides sculpturatus]|uniref:HAUS augmin-like complex subunit 1 n=1 Tax=Centruroides sculpturatus TaxID=218467 RepID=UPI000C6D1DA5|nr:HAUS augmin-like complex subunit 1 [Centruroides sculpturatus]
MSSNVIQIQEIHNWLKIIYQNENIPTFEINNRTLNILASIMTRYQEKEKHSQIIMNYLKNSAAEYNITAEKLSKILQQVKINLHTQLHSDISGLALVASVLNLKNTSLSSFIHEMERIFEETAKISETRKDESKISGKLSSDSIAMQQKLQQLERELQEAEKWWQDNLPEIHNNKKYSSFLKSKVKEYDKELNHLEKYLQKMQIDPNIYHSTLVKKSESIKEMKEKLNTVQMKLQCMANLPANEDLARVKIAEAEMELEKLEREFSSRVESIIPKLHPVI